jgi:hypothetical protein
MLCILISFYIHNMKVLISDNVGRHVMFSVRNISFENLVLIPFPFTLFFFDTVFLQHLFISLPYITST